MNTHITAAVVQASWRRLADADEVRSELKRYLRLVRNKGADLAVLPEQFGLMLAIPLASGLRGSLVKKAIGGRGFWGKLVGALSGGAAEMLGGLPAVLPRLIAEQSDVMRDTYVELLSAAAREHAVYLVGGSLYLQDEDGQVRAMSPVFDRTGDLLGWQAKFHLDPMDEAYAMPGDTLNTFETEFGRLGVLLGGDILYPELTRALAYRGVVALANPALATTPAEWQRMRIVLNARAQENQIFAAQAFLIGDNEFTPEIGDTFEGKSGIVAPVELTPRTDGILVEVGSPKAEGVVSAAWDFAALRHLWETGSAQPRRTMRSHIFHDLLHFDYQSGATIEERFHAIEETRRHPVLPAPEPTVLRPEGEWPGEAEAKRIEAYEVPEEEIAPTGDLIADVSAEADALTGPLNAEETAETGEQPSDESGEQSA